MFQHAKNPVRKLLQQNPDTAYTNTQAGPVALAGSLN